MYIYNEKYIKVINIKAIGNTNSHKFTKYVSITCNACKNSHKYTKA